MGGSPNGVVDGNKLSTLTTPTIPSVSSFQNNRISPAPSPSSAAPQSSAVGHNHNIHNRTALLKEIESKDFTTLIQQEVNYFYEFIDFSLQQEFKEFANRYGKGRSSDFLLLTLLIITIFLLPQSIIQLYFTIQGYYVTSIGTRKVQTFALVTAILSVFAIGSSFLSGWILFFQDNLFQWLKAKGIGSRLLASISLDHQQNVEDLHAHNKSIMENAHSISVCSKASIYSDGATPAAPDISPSQQVQSKIVPSSSFRSVESSSNNSLADNNLTWNKWIMKKLWKLMKKSFSFCNLYKLWSTKRCILDSINSFFMLQIQLFFILQFLRILFQQNCFLSDNIAYKAHQELSFIHDLVFDIWGNDTCFSEHHDMKTGFLNANSLQLFLLPFIFFKGLPHTSMKTIWLNYIAAVSTFFISMITNHTYRTVPSGIVWMLLTFFAIRDFQVRNMILFLSTRNVKETMVSRNKAMEETHATEMRSLIANVAHDLKTPLASFTTGLDLIQITLDEFHSSLSIKDLSGREMVDSIQQCLTNIRNTNNFMLMTINRCIDYTKVSKGIKLLPRYESIDLMKTIQLPLNCMRNIQSKMKITLLPIVGKQICSYLITDKLWLQENLLCLLSNAVKYSSDGEVTISLKIQHMDLFDQDEDEDYSGEESASDVGDGEVGGQSQYSRGSGGGLGVPSVKDSQIIKVTNLKSKSSNNERNSIGNRVMVVESFDDKQSMSFALPSHHEEVSMASKIALSRPTSTKVLQHDMRPVSQQSTIVPGGRGSTAAVGGGNRPNMASVVRSMSQKSLGSHASNNMKEMLVIEVEDTGIGMTDEAMKILFNPFHQTQRLAGGTGLGLFSLAKRVEALHGKYGVRRRRDGRQGSLFWFAIPYRPDTFMAEAYGTLFAEAGSVENRLPVIRRPSISIAPVIPSVQGNPEMITTDSVSVLTVLEHLAPKEEILIPTSSPNRSMRGIQMSDKNESSKAIITSSKLHPLPSVSTVAAAPVTSTDPSLRILIVDDSPAILKMASMMLRKLGHTLFEAENGQIAVNLVRDSLADEESSTSPRYDVILMDLQMPVMDGLEAIHRIRSIEALFMQHRHWIIGCSANSDIETQQAAISAGANMFMPKPFNLTTFCAAIAQVQL